MVHVCVKIPAPKGHERPNYEACGSLEEWVRKKLGPHGLYVGRPKRDNGWNQSPTIAAGSMFANPFQEHPHDYSFDDILRLYREYIELRMNPNTTIPQVIEVLPPKERRLAEGRWAKSGADGMQKVGAVAHLKLDVVGTEFREQLRRLHGRPLGSFSDERIRNHANILIELAQRLEGDRLMVEAMMDDASDELTLGLDRKAL